MHQWFVAALDGGQYVLLVLLDMLTAFDIVDHGILLDRLTLVIMGHYRNSPYMVIPFRVPTSDLCRSEI